MISGILGTAQIGEALLGSFEDSFSLTVSPDGIASAEAFGSVKLQYPQNVAPAGIASAQAVPSPKVIFEGFTLPMGIASAEAFGSAKAIRQQFAKPLGIASAEAIPKPVVAGPIIAIAIDSAEVVPAPMMNVVQTVDLGGAGIASAEAVSTGAKVSNTTSIHPSGIASVETFGTPGVRGGPKKIVLESGIYQGAMGIPGVSGGNTGLQIFIGGVNRTMSWQGSNKAGLLRRGAASPSVQSISGGGSGGSAQPLSLQSQTLGRWSAVFDLIDYTGALLPRLNETVLVTENGVTRFNGLLTQIQIEPIAGTTTLIYHCGCVDRSAVCDRRRVLQTTFLAGMDAADVYRLIVTNYLNGEGVTANNVPASLGPLDSDLVLAGQLPSVTQAFDALSTAIGGVWWFDTNNDLNTPLLADVPACPYSIVYPVTNARDLSMTAKLDAFKTKVYAVSNQNVLPGSASSPGPVGPQGLSVTETYTLPQQAAVDRGFVFGALITNFPILAITSIKVNGVSKTFATGTAPVDVTLIWWYFPGVPYITPPVSGGDVPNSGDVVEVKYISNQPAAQVVAGDPLQPDPSTSGIFESVENAPNVLYQDDLNAIATAVLARDGNVVPKSLQYSTDIPGAAVGQKIHVDHSLIDLPHTDMLITAVNGATQDGVDLGHGSSFRWTVQAVNTADQGNETKWFERLVARTELSLPVDQPAFPTLFLVGTLNAGPVAVTPKIIGKTIRVTQIGAIAGQPPENQDLLIDIFSRSTGASIFSRPLIIPAGTTSLVLWSELANDPAPTYLFKDDILDVQPIVYRVTGLAPLPAAYVTLEIRGIFLG